MTRLIQVHPDGPRIVQDTAYFDTWYLYFDGAYSDPMSLPYAREVLIPLQRVYDDGVRP